MPPAKLEERVAALEEELSTLKSRVDTIDPSVPWWERIAGTFQGDSIYAKAMKLGRDYRQADSSGRTKK